MNPEIVLVLSEELVISPREYPTLALSIEHFARRGRLRHVLGGYYSSVEAAGSFEVRVAAARAVYPNGVFLRETAARLTAWRNINVGRVQVATDRRRQFTGFGFERRSVPAELTVWDGQHFIADPALTVLDLTDSSGSAVISDALRREVVTVESLERALELTKGRPGNRRRAQLVREARHEPWSELEREAHVLLRKAHVPEWVANHPVMVRDKLYFIDLAVPGVKLAAEVDGWQFHRSFDSFVSDRRKWNDLALDGWTLLHFTANSMDELVPQMQEALAMIRTR